MVGVVQLAVVTFTVAEQFPVPPEPETVPLYTEVEYKAPVDAVPFRVCAPPLILKEVASVDDQERVELPPLLTVAGLAVKVQVGAFATGVLYL